MEFTPALVITKPALTDLMHTVAIRAAKQALAEVQHDLNYDPEARRIDQLRRFLDDRGTVECPREIWANGDHIRAIQLNRNGNPRSAAWFQQFKRESGLGECPSRASALHGRMREWCFADIANAWERYYNMR